MKSLEQKFKLLIKNGYFGHLLLNFLTTFNTILKLDDLKLVQIDPLVYSCIQLNLEYSTQQLRLHYFVKSGLHEKK